MLNELLILTKIKAGDIKAFEELFRCYYSPLCWYAASITGRMEVAESTHKQLEHWAEPFHFCISSGDCT